MIDPTDTITHPAPTNAKVVIEYHRGLLSADRTRDANLSQLASDLFESAKRQEIHLVSRRHGPGDYSYIAISRPSHAHRHR
jgi:hypothetical protein